MLVLLLLAKLASLDYSGTQACQALKEEGYKVILLNSNPATIMTDPNIADKTYIEPITTYIVEKIIKTEKPDAILPTVGGQTALNCVLDLERKGILKENKVELIGANADSIKKAEDRALFQKAMENIGLETPKNAIVNNLDDALKYLNKIGLPAIIRPSFTMGGAGGGVAYTIENYKKIVQNGLNASPISEVLIDESVIGWKEYEMEVVRDKNDNTIIICSIENIDPMGVHTGDSVTVAPALTLTDKEYQNMRNASISVLREIGVETGGSNVQFAINPKNGKLLVIEMNPRVSRSSALASKATGFPIAKVASKLAIGLTLDEIKNDITGGAMPASFEPSIDYIVTKIPKFTFKKFRDSDGILNSSMQSIGESMAIGRSFTESLQKALISIESGFSGLDEVKINSSIKEERIKIIQAKLEISVPNKILIIAQAIREGIDIKEINKITKYDLWFLEQIKDLVEIEQDIKKNKLSEDRETILFLKKKGFSDKRLAHLSNKTEKYISDLREKLNIHPVYKRVDSCAGEFNSVTAYMYSCYET